MSCGFPLGAVTAVAGYSGAGKSTLVACCYASSRPNSGRILIDGVPLAEIDPAQWHRRIAFVEQNTFLFNASVRDNIGYGDFEADDDAIRDAARVAQADDFIDEPAGRLRHDDRRERLSPVPRPTPADRVGPLAAAAPPDILILDEATNALDRPHRHRPAGGDRVAAGRSGR